MTKFKLIAVVCLLLILTGGLFLYRELKPAAAILGTLGPTPQVDPDGTAEIHLVDQSGHAVGDAEVYLVQRISHNGHWDDSTESAAGPVKSDDQGVAHFSGLESAKNVFAYSQTIYAQVPGQLAGFTERTIAASYPQSLDSARAPVMLYDAQSIDGTVSLPPGTSPAGLTTQLWTVFSRQTRDVLLFSRTEDFQRHFPELFRTSVDSEGKFSIPNVPALSDLVVFSVEGPGLARVQTRVTREQLSATANVKLFPQAVIAGVLSFADSAQPAAGVQLQLIPNADSKLSISRGTYTTTDAQGQFRFDHLPPATFRIISATRSADWVMASAGPFKTEPGQTIQGVNLRLERGALLTGSVIAGLLRKPIGGATIELFNPTDPDSMMRNIAQTLSNDDGSFTLRLPSGENLLRINISADGYRVPDNQRTKPIRVNPDGTISGEAVFHLQSTGPF